MKKNDSFIDNPRNIRKIKLIFYSVLFILLLCDLFIDRHSHFPWEGLTGFHAFYGFISCGLIIAVSKILGRLCLQRGEDYYD
jgi:hypothetical protein